MNEIKIKCKSENTLELAEMTEFQGGLKARTDIDYDKIKLSIIKYGFSFPFFIWKNKNKNMLSETVLKQVMLFLIYLVVLEQHLLLVKKQIVLQDLWNLTHTIDTHNGQRKITDR